MRTVVCSGFPSLATTPSHSKYDYLLVALSPRNLKKCIVGVHLESKLLKTPRCSAGIVDSTHHSHSATVGTIGIVGTVGSCRRRPGRRIGLLYMTNRPDTPTGVAWRRTGARKLRPAWPRGGVPRAGRLSLSLPTTCSQSSANRIPRIGRDTTSWQLLRSTVRDGGRNYPVEAKLENMLRLARVRLRMDVPVNR
jgi:hypothetical protein